MSKSSMKSRERSFRPPGYEVPKIIELDEDMHEELDYLCELYDFDIYGLIWKMCVAVEYAGWPVQNHPDSPYSILTDTGVSKIHVPIFLTEREELRVRLRARRREVGFYLADVLRQQTDVLSPVTEFEGRLAVFNETPGEQTEDLTEEPTAGEPGQGGNTQS